VKRNQSERRSMNLSQDQNDLEEWEGDIEELRGHVNRLANDPDLCDRVFMSRYEALVTGLTLGRDET
jgi:hypothetical protein